MKARAKRPEPLPGGWRWPRVVAHRGGGTIAPENTLAGMRAAFERGHRAVEFDVMLARDHVPVLMHDEILGRTVQGRAYVSDLMSAQLQHCDAGNWFSPDYWGEPVPLFADVAAWLRARDIWMNIEIKPVPGFDKETGRAVGEITQAMFGDEPDVRKRPVLSSFSVVALAAAKKAAPDIARGLLMSRVASDWKKQLKDLDCVALHCDHRHLTKSLAKAIKAEGYGLFCYTANDPDRAREILAWGVDAFCTDRIDLIGPDFA